MSEPTITKSQSNEELERADKGTQKLVARLSGLLSRAALAPAPAPEPGGERCPHPARNGIHEDYGRPGGPMTCRACGRVRSQP